MSTAAQSRERKDGGNTVTRTIDRKTAPETTGRVLHRAASYDFTVWLMTLGRERAFREKMLSFARLAPGESVLDVGCGTGNLAILAKRRAGPTGCVHGIDASAEMIARARSKVRKARVEVVLQHSLAEALPFPQARFDVVLCTVMLHHLPHKTRLQSLNEMRRVLKPGGRALLVDFEEAARVGKGVFAHLRHRHGRVTNADLSAAAREAGFNVRESGEIGFRNMHFVLASP